jgi:hypothetical protein
MESERRNKAAQVLTAVGQKLHSPRLTALATKVPLDAFTRVKKAIDDLVAQLLKEDEIKHKDFCVEEFNTNQLQTEKKQHEKENLLALIEDLELQIKTLTSEIETLKRGVCFFIGCVARSKK